LTVRAGHARDAYLAAAVRSAPKGPDRAGASEYNGRVAVTVLPRAARPPTLAEFELADLENIRLLLRGDSVVDWHKLHFTDHAAVDRFLRLCELDPTSEAELDRLEALRTDAVDYLTRVYQLALSPTRSPTTSRPATCSSSPRAPARTSARPAWC
jgi:hypothetical protein